MAGKLNEPYEPAASFLLVLLAVTLGHHALTAVRKLNYFFLTTLAS